VVGFAWVSRCFFHERIFRGLRVNFSSSSISSVVAGDDIRLPKAPLRIPRPQKRGQCVLEKKNLTSGNLGAFGGRGRRRPSNSVLRTPQGAEAEAERFKNKTWQMGFGAAPHLKNAQHLWLSCRRSRKRVPINSGPCKISDILHNVNYA